MTASKLLAVLAWPAAGVIGSAAALISIHARVKGVAVTAVSAGAVLIGTCVADPFLPAAGYYFFVAFLLSSALAIVAWRFRKDAISRVISSAPSLAILAFYILAATTGEYPGVFIGPVKSALNLGACGWLAAAGLREWSRRPDSYR